MPFLICHLAASPHPETTYLRQPHVSFNHPIIAAPPGHKKTTAPRPPPTQINGFCAGIAITVDHRPKHADRRLGRASPSTRPATQRDLKRLAIISNGNRHREV
jgi:hypothetical protein